MSLIDTVNAFNDGKIDVVKQNVEVAKKIGFKNELWDDFLKFFSKDKYMIKFYTDLKGETEVNVASYVKLIEDEKFYREGLYPPYKKLCRILFADKKGTKSYRCHERYGAEIKRV